MRRVNLIMTGCFRKFLMHIQHSRESNWRMEHFNRESNESFSWISRVKTRNLERNERPIVVAIVTRTDLLCRKINNLEASFRLGIHVLYFHFTSSDFDFKKCLPQKFYLSPDKPAFKNRLSGPRNSRLGQLGQLISGPLLKIGNTFVIFGSYCIY